MKMGPCLRCPDRSITCHASCEKYIAWRKEMDRAKQKEREYNRSLTKNSIYF